MNQSDTTPPSSAGTAADRLLSRYLGGHSTEGCGPECCWPWHVDTFVTPTPVRHPLDTFNSNWVLEGRPDAKVRLVGPSPVLPEDVAGAYRRMAETAQVAGVIAPTSPAMVKIRYCAEQH